MFSPPGCRLAEITGRGLPMRFGGTAISTPLATSFSSTRISSGERLAGFFFFGMSGSVGQRYPTLARNSANEIRRNVAAKSALPRLGRNGNHGSKMAPHLVLPRSGRRDLLKAAAASILLPLGLSPRPAFAAAEEGTPAATQGTGWKRKSQWRFGTAPGNDIARFSDWLRAGWFMNDTRYLNDECETYNTTDRSDSNPNFAPAADHCDIIAIWNGGPVASAIGNGSVSSLMMRYNVPSPSPVGYYEIECRIPSVSGAWPAWWTLGHAAGAPQGSSSWGPEIDINETYDTKTDLMSSTLHGSRTPSLCFMRGGGNPPGRGETSATRYEAHPWNMG